MVRQIDTMSVDHDPQVHISSSIIDLPISKQQVGTTSEASLHEGLAVSQSSVESPPSLTHTPTTSASSSDSEKSHPQEQLTGVKSLMDEDDNEPMIVDVTPSRRSDTLEDAHHKGTGGDDSLPDSSPTCCRPTPIRAGSGGAGPLVSSFFGGGVEASEDVEERDPPVERASPPGVTSSSSDGHFFRPIGGLDYEPKQQQQQWDHMYSNSLCADEIFFPSCDFHFSEQLDLMTVRLQSNRDVTGGSHPGTQDTALAALANLPCVTTCVPFYLRTSSNPTASFLFLSVVIPLGKFFSFRIVTTPCPFGDMINTPCRKRW
jgi:hypothetical protein